MLERRGQCVGRQMAALLINGHFKHLSGQIYHTVLDWCAQYHPDHKIIVILSINKQNIDLFCRVRQKRWCVGSGSANIIITDTSNISTTFTTYNFLQSLLSLGGKKTFCAVLGVCCSVWQWTGYCDSLWRVEVFSVSGLIRSSGDEEEPGTLWYLEQI